MTRSYGEADAPRAAGAAGPRVRVGMISLGCAKNLVDSEVMLGHLDRAGVRLVRNPADADVLVVNTCGFIEAAREESVQTILEAAEYKKSGPLKRLVVAGCLVQRYAAELRESLPEVDAFLGLDELDRIVDLVGLQPLPDAEATSLASPPALRVLPLSAGIAGEIGPAAVASTSPPWGRSTYLYDHDAPRLLATPPWTAYVKIAEGCDHSCAFCAIPSFRGAFRSRRPSSILREVESLVAGGVREVNLIAQDSSQYGRDLGIREGLARLLQGLDEIDGLRWVRVHYLYPNTVTDTLIEAMAGLDRVVEYVDMPLQHAHAATLRRMRRGGSSDSHLRLLERLRRKIPGVALRSTMIVGFPGETDAEFDTLLDFVERAEFDHLGVFVYSHEQSTAAFRERDDVAPQVKERRRDTLMACQREIVARRNASRVGERVQVLVEGAHPETEHLLVGRMRTQAIDVDGQVLLNEGTARPGEFVSVELTETAGYDLVGRVLGTD